MFFVSNPDATLNARGHASLVSPGSLASRSTNITVSLANASPGGLGLWATNERQRGSRMFGPNASFKRVKMAPAGHPYGTPTPPL